jgi:uncharacterized protein
MSYILLGIVVIAIIFGPNLWVKYVLKKYNKQNEALGGTGRELARYLLDAADLQIVQVKEGLAGQNYYDPSSQDITIEKAFLDAKSVTALAIAAHECAHAVQHKNDEKLFKARIAYIQKTALFDKIAYGILLTSPLLFAYSYNPRLLLFQFLLGVAFMSVRLGVHLLTLPVEWDASFAKALPALENANVLTKRNSKKRGLFLRLAL